jgi:hypothetical protein
MTYPKVELHGESKFKGEVVGDDSLTIITAQKKKKKKNITR